VSPVSRKLSEPGAGGLSGALSLRRRPVRGEGGSSAPPPRGDPHAHPDRHRVHAPRQRRRLAGGGGDHPHAGWTFKDVGFDEAAYELKGREQEEAGALLLGRQSYEEFAPVWPQMDEFERFNEIPKYVVSTTLSEETVAAGHWSPVHVLRSLDDVAALKETEGGPIQVHGSATLAKNLMAAGLVDRIHLLVFPVVLGSGKRLFADDADKTKLTLLEQESYSNGVQKLVYALQR
jgi:dihydrofolate reductase